MKVYSYITIFNFSILIFIYIYLIIRVAAFMVFLGYPANLVGWLAGVLAVAVVSIE